MASSVVEHPEQKLNALYRFHRVLIRSAAIAAALMTLWSFWSLSRTGEVVHLLTGIIAAGVGAGLIVYLRWFNRAKTQ